MYYDMDVQQSLVLAWTYFANPDYLVVQCWSHAMHLSLDTINQTEPHTYHYTRFFEGTMGYMPFSIPCTELLAVIVVSIAVLSF